MPGLLRVFIVCVLAAAGFLAALHWRQSDGNPGAPSSWWVGALAIYAVFFVSVLLSIGAGAGWALDDVDDPREERSFAVAIVLALLLVPLVLVLGEHVLTVPFHFAPVGWPWWADITARVAVSAPGMWFAISLTVRLIRRTRRSATEVAAIWSTGIMFLLSLVLVTLWPWMGAWFPVWARAVVLLILLTVAVLLAKRIRSAPLGSPMGS